MKDDKSWGNIPVYNPQNTHIPVLSTTVPTTTAVTRSTTITSYTTSVTPSKPTTSKTMPPRRAEVTVVVDEIPDFCNTSFDAVSIIRKETFFFKGKYIWRLGPKGLYAGYPAQISRLWYKLPENLNQVDAVYERQDGKIVFFIGQ